MAIFKRDTTKKKAAAVDSSSQSKENLSHVLRHARITEKATMLGEKGVYTFIVAENVTKNDIAKAVKKLYNVMPHKVAVVGIPSKAKRNARTGRYGVKGGGKKAYVYLKKGETINVA